MNTYTNFLVQCAIVIFFFVGRVAVAKSDDAPPAVRAAFEQLLHINHANLNEPGGSHGSYGLKIGLGMQKLPQLNERNEFLAAAMQIKKPGMEQQSSTQRLTLIKGTPYPVDLGMTVAMINGSSIFPLGGFLQATFLEGLGWPSLSLRYHYATLVGLRDLRLYEHGAALVLSKSLFTWVKPFVSASSSLYKLSGNGALPRQYGLTSTSADSYEESGWFSMGSVGLKFILDGTFDVVGEFQIDEKAQQSFAGKLSVLL